MSVNNVPPATLLDGFTNVVTVLLVLSISAERLVEIVKGMFQYLNDAKLDRQEERRRQLSLHVLSVVAGCIVVFLAQGFVVSALPSLSGKLLGWQGIGLGILASGGSSLWNTVLTYLLSVKNLKRDQVLGSKPAPTAQALQTTLPSDMPQLGLPGVR